MSCLTEQTEPRIVVVTLASDASASEWLELPKVESVVSFSHAVASGSRFGRRVLGLGLDSALVAIRAVVRPRRRVTYLATNPWIAVFLRFLTRRPIAFTGLYASPGTKNWRILRAVLRRCSLVALSQVEMRNWTAAGGRAQFVRYGNTFPYTPVLIREAGPLRIFVGGSSDRDHAALAQLEHEVLESGREIELLVAVGGERSIVQCEKARVVRHGRLAQKEFGAAIARCDVAYVPLLDRERAAGQMILVGALQVGTPVLISGGLGMDGYIDGKFVRGIGRASAGLDGIVRSLSSLPSRSATHDYWSKQFSRRSYLQAVESAVVSMRASEELR